MNIREAVKYLEEYKITSSEQVLRRWIRQGKIKATMRSKKEGYQVSKGSLQHFIRKRLGLSSLDDWVDKSEEYERKIKRLERDNARLRTRCNMLSEELRIKSSENFRLYNNRGQSKNIFGAEAETKETFKRLFHHIHPDKGGDPELFSKVNKAYRYIFRSE